MMLLKRLMALMAPEGDGAGGAAAGGSGAASGDGGSGGSGAAAGGDSAAGGAVAGGAAAGAAAGQVAGQPGQQQTKQDSQPVTWPTDWRERLATGADGKVDEKKLGRLQRYASIDDYNNAHFELVAKMSKGELKANVPFPEKGAPEEQAAWRKEMGIPDAPDKYDLTLGNGIVIGDDDKPLVDEFLKFAHAQNASPAAVKSTLEWFLGDYREQVQQKAAEQTAEAKQRTEDTLRKDWGADYRPNMTAINNILEANIGANAGLKQRILNAVAIEPEFAKLFANLARQINPVTTLTGIDPANMATSVEEEIAKIETTMKTNRAAYNRDEKMQARLRELYSARERMKGQQRAA